MSETGVVYEKKSYLGILKELRSYLDSLSDAQESTQHVTSMAIQKLKRSPVVKAIHDKLCGEVAHDNLVCIVDKLKDTIPTVDAYKRSLIIGALTALVGILGGTYAIAKKVKSATIIIVSIILILGSISWMGWKHRKIFVESKKYVDALVSKLAEERDVAFTSPNAMLPSDFSMGIEGEPLLSLEPSETIVISPNVPQGDIPTSAPPPPAPVIAPPAKPVVPTEQKELEDVDALLDRLSADLSSASLPNVHTGRQNLSHDQNIYGEQAPDTFEDIRAQAAAVRFAKFAQQESDALARQQIEVHRQMKQQERFAKRQQQQVNDPNVLEDTLVQRKVGGDDDRCWIMLSFCIAFVILSLLFMFYFVRVTYSFRDTNLLKIEVV